MSPLPVEHEVMVDWDMTDWSAVPVFDGEFDDISDDVVGISWGRGKDKEEGNAPAGTLELKIRGSLYAKYSPANEAGDLYGQLLPWRIVRVITTHNSIPYSEFFGFISKIKVDPHRDHPAVYIYVTDGLDLLARQLVTQDYENRSPVSDGSAIDAILDAAGWSDDRRYISTDGGDTFLNYPAVSSY